MTDDPKACAEDLDLMLPRAVARWAERDGDRPFLEEVIGRSASYGELEADVQKWGAALAEIGVEAGQRVSSFLPQSIDAHTLWFAGARYGALHVPINPQLRGDLLRHVISDSGTEVAFARPEQVPQLRDAGLPDRVRLIVVPEVVVPEDAASSSELPPGTTSWPEVLAATTQHLDLAQPEPADVCSVIYTSGTTGPSKGVLVTWAQISNAIGLRPRQLVSPAHGYYVPWPPFHVMGLTPLAVMAAAGGRAVLRERASVSAFWGEVIAFRCAFATIGPIARLLLDQPPGPQDEENPLVAIVGVSGPDRDEFKRRFHVEATQVYGSTEAAYPIVNREQSAGSRHFTGRLRPGYRARIVDADFVDLPDGAPGELLVAPPSPVLLSRGYLSRPDLTEASRLGEWYCTRDLFVRHPDGTFEFVDRMGDSIRRFGENISSGAIETVALQQPGVLECAAVAVPSEVSGEEVHLVVVPTAEGFDPETLVHELSAVLPRFMLPTVVSVWGSLPKTPNGKIQKASLRAAGVPAGAWRSPRSRAEPSGASSRG